MIHGRSARFAAAAFKSASSHASWLPKPPARTCAVGEQRVSVTGEHRNIGSEGTRTSLEDGIDTLWRVVVVSLRVDADEVRRPVVERLPHVGTGAALLGWHAEAGVVPVSAAHTHENPTSV